jgi:hypothetical protein
MAIFDGALLVSGCSNSIMVREHSLHSTTARIAGYGVLKPASYAARNPGENPFMLGSFLVVLDQESKNTWKGTYDSKAYR